MADDPETREFIADLNAQADEMEGYLLALARQTVTRIAEQVVQATPVDTGNLRASWQYSLNTPSDAEEPGDPSAKIALTVARMRLGDTFVATNSARYALRVEFGFVGEDSLGRFYNQPGQFFVTRTVAKWPTIAEVVRRELEG